METIELRYFPVAVAPLGYHLFDTRFQHMYLVYDPSEGPKQFIRGGPAEDGIGTALG